jgi:XTP/dITP diphosphohydrolase
MLENLPFSIIAQSEFAVPEVEETGTTFVENAIIKARHAARITGLPAIADDSGLEVDALKGAPGIYSARFAGEPENDARNSDPRNNAPRNNDARNIDKLLVELADTPPAARTARFHCVLVFMRHADDPTPLICHGSWEGEIATAPKGENGFGYDPVFWVSSEQKMAAELSKSEKNRLSHRGKALRLLLQALMDRIEG